MRANLFSKLVNASGARHMYVRIKNSQMNYKIVDRLYDFGFVQHYSLGSHQSPYASQSHLWVQLKYTPDLQPVLKSIKSISKPSRRVLLNSEDLISLTSGQVTHTLKSLGFGKMLPGQVVLINTRKYGILELFEAVEKDSGGEVLCIVY